MTWVKLIIKLLMELSLHVLRDNTVCKYRNVRIQLITLQDFLSAKNSKSKK